MKRLSLTVCLLTAVNSVASGRNDGLRTAHDGVPVARTPQAPLLWASERKNRKLV